MVLPTKFIQEKAYVVGGKVFLVASETVEGKENKEGEYAEIIELHGKYC